MSHIQPDTHLPTTPKIKIYTAIISQTGTDAPTATILKNNIGNIVWTRTVQGVYAATLNNAFPYSKTAIFVNHRTSAIFISASWNTENVINIVNTQVSNGQNIDNIPETYIEIRVYNI